MKIFFEKHKGSVATTWLIYYLILLFIPLSMSSYLYVHLCREINDEIVSNSQSSINFMAKNIESQFMETENFFEDVYCFDGTAGLIKELNNDGDVTMYNASLYIKNLKAMQKNGGAIKKFILYFEDSGKIISSTGMYDEYTYYRLFFKEYDSDFEHWKKTMFRNDKTFFRMGNELNPKLFRASEIYYPDARKNKIHLLTEINTAAVVENIGLFDNMENEIYFVTDDKNNLLWQVGGSENASELLKSQEKATINGIDYVITSADFKYFGMKIFHAVERKAAFEKIIVAHRIILICVTVCVIIGLALICYFVRRHYREIKTMLSVLDYTDDVDEDELNELRLIEKGIIKQKNENLRYKEILLEQRQNVLNYTVIRMLKGVNEDIDNIFVNLNATPVSDRFVVAVMYMQDQKTMNTIAGLIRDSINGRRNCVFWINFEGYAIFVVNCYDYNIDGIEEDFEYARIYCEDNYNCGFCSVISEMCENVNRIPFEYEQIKKLIKSLVLVGKEGVFVRNKYSDNEPDDYYYYPVQMQRQLISSINSGDMDELHIAVEKIYYENFEKKNLDIENINCLFNNIIGTLISTIDTNGLRGKSEDLNPNIIVNKLFKNDNINDMMSFVTDIAEKCCLFVKEQMDNKKSDKIDDILSYVHQNYSDANMSVSQIAEKFNISHTIISKLFKKEMKMGMLEYITVFRLNKAIQLLTSTDKTVNEIAESVGFGNYRTFARLFVRQYGITAKQYRELYRK